MKFDPQKPFDLPLLPPNVNFRHEQFIDVLLKTRTELGELNGYSYSLPNPSLLLSPAVIKESVASSNIENINTTMEEALQAQLFPEAEQKKPDKEVLRYRDAIMWGFDNLKKIPISSVNSWHPEKAAAGSESGLPQDPEPHREQCNGRGSLYTAPGK